VAEVQDARADEGPLLRQDRAPHSRELAAPAFQDRATCHQSEKLLAKIGIPDCVVKQGPLRAEARDDRLGRVAQDRVGGRACRHLHGKRINVRQTVDVIDLQQPKLGRAFCHRDLLDDPHLTNFSRLGAEPATTAQIVRQNCILQRRPLTIGEGRFVRTDFTRATLRNADLRGAHAVRARFLEADMTGAHLQGADLTDAEMDV